MPPPVDAEEAMAAIARIRERRERIDDPQVWRMSEDLVDVLSYLRRYSRDVPRWVAEADVIDGLTLRLRLWWLGEEAEVWLLQAARRANVAPAEVGRRLGIGTRQGVHDRLRLALRKVAVLRGDPAPAAPVSGADDADQVWLSEHSGAVREVAGHALRFGDLASDEAAEWLADVARDVRDGAMTPGSVQVLRFALAELAVSPGVESAAADHPVHALLARWDEIWLGRPS